MTGDLSYTSLIPTLQVKAEDYCVSWPLKAKWGL